MFRDPEAQLAYKEASFIRFPVGECQGQGGAHLILTSFKSLIKRHVTSDPPLKLQPPGIPDLIQHAALFFPPQHFSPSNILYNLCVHYVCYLSVFVHYDVSSQGHVFSQPVVLVPAPLLAQCWMLTRSLLNAQRSNP